MLTTPNAYLKLIIIFISISSLPVLAANNKEISEALSAHNTLRAKHGVPNLIWDEDLAEYAENYARQCKFQHSSSSYGENLAAGYPSITEAINSWYSESENYNYDKPGFSSNTGHFTQLIWKDTKNLGCAYVPCNEKNGTPGNFLVCEYSPQGNMINKGFFASNVLPPVSSQNGSKK